MRKRDLWAGLAIAVVGLAFLIDTLFMPWKTESFDWYGGPGFVPAILAALLVMCGLLMVFRALLNGRFYAHLEAEQQNEVVAEADETVRASTVNLPSYLRSEAIRVLMVVLLCAIYVFVLIGHIPYLIATALFVGAFILLFQGGGWRGGWAKSLSAWAKILLISALTSLMVWIVFVKIFAVALP